MAIPPLVLRIYADSSGVKKGVAQAQTQVGGLRASIQRNASLIKTGLVAGVVGGLAVSIKAAGDLGEAVNATNVTFKNNAGVVREWAENAAESAGLAEAEALQAAAGFGAMFESAGLAGPAAAKMAVDVGQLAGDMASLRNADPTEMLERMRAGLAGEAEPLRRFGIFISEARVEQEALRMGLIETGQALTDAQKIQARYNIILADSTEAQGDFARTAGESLPNQLRKLRAQAINLGASIGKVLLPAVTGVLRAFNALIGIIRPIAPALLAVAAAFGAMWAVGKLIALPAKIMETTTAFGKLVLSLGPFGALATAAAGSITLIALAIDGANSRLDEFEAELVSLGLTSKEAARETDAFRAAQERVGPTTRFQGRRMHDLTLEIERNKEVANGWAMRQRAYAAASNESADADRNATRATKELRLARLALAGGLLGVVTQLGSLKDAQREVNRLEESGKRGTEAYKDAKLTLLQEIVASKEGLADYAEALKDEGATYPQVRAKLVELGRQYGLTRQEVLDVLKPLKDVNAEWAKVPKNIKTTYTIDLAGDGQNAVGLEFGQRAWGGPVNAGTPYIVGERGPELFIPKQSGEIIPNHETTTATPASQVIHVHIGEEEVDRIVVRGLRRAAARS